MFPMNWPNFRRILHSELFPKKRPNFHRISHSCTFPLKRPNFRHISDKGRFQRNSRMNPGEFTLNFALGNVSPGMAEFPPNFAVRDVS
ncbi:MAG: hypothetical protein Q8881_03585, partial [Sweet potato little leaf phytoplasma]|nr:hypothetical protein [Sweet potato little leaf phytoplasma]